MISQADIIRALVNQNCTDEIIMTTALSPGCTPPKLLEKFTEAERFDLALDVSMKLGWDVLPIWKTWAMRCLANRNFPEARKKFRHCFQMVRSQQGRASLLNDILKVLTKMKEQRLALAEEIELIKQGKRLQEHHAFRDQSVRIDQAKPKIFNECMSYLREYGNSMLKVKFYIGNQLWDQAIEILMDQPELTKFFITEVVPYSLTTGNLGQLLSTLIKHDPEFERSTRYLTALYGYCAREIRYNTLYFIQKDIGDHVAAAENRVTNFFLKPPTVDYKELNHRLDHLTDAFENLKEHLAELDQQLIKPELFAKMSRDETERRLRTIGFQLDITRNFAINEVSGCINGIKIVSDEREDKTTNEDKSDNSPVTMFDQGVRRRTFLAALVLSYYDDNFDTCFSQSGFDLAVRLIEEFGLDRLQVFKMAMRIIIEDESATIVDTADLLLKRLRDDYLACTRRMRKRKRTRSNLVELSLDTLKISSKESDEVIARPLKPSKARRPSHIRPTPPQSEAPPESNEADESSPSYSFVPKDKSAQPGSSRAARLLCDEVVRDAVINYREPDYKMELSKLLSIEARIELNIELGKLSVAQRLAFDLNRRDYVMLIVREADRLKQDHIKEVCQKWLAKN